MAASTLEQLRRQAVLLDHGANTAPDPNDAYELRLLWTLVVSVATLMETPERGEAVAGEILTSTRQVLDTLVRERRTTYPPVKRTAPKVKRRGR